MSCKDEILAAAVESEFYIGDEDLDDSPIRYLEIVGFQQSKLRIWVKYVPHRWAVVNNALLLKIVFLKINPQRIFSANQPMPCGDATVLFGVFRI